MLREFEEEIKKLRQQLDAEGGELEEIEEVEEVEESEEGSSGGEDHDTPGKENIRIRVSQNAKSC